MEFAKLKKKYYTEYVAFLSSLIWGMFAHGYMLTNKITSHDDLGALYSAGGGIYNGRWMTGSFSNFHLMNMPWFNGIVFLLILSLTAALIVNALQITKPAFAFCIGACLSTYPVVTSMLLYMFTALAYACGFFLAVLAAWIIMKHRRWFMLQFAVVCIVISLGFYQAYFPVTASLLLIGLFKYFSLEKHTGKDMIKTSLVDFFLLLEGMMGYILVQKILLKINHMEMASYQNMSNFGVIDISKLPEQVGNAYQNFFLFFQRIYPRVMYKNTDAIVVLFFLLAVLYFIGRCLLKKRWCAAIFSTGAALIFPLSCNLVYIYGAEGVHTLMMYGNVCTLILIITAFHELKEKTLATRGGKRIAIGCCGTLILCLSITNCRASNTVYLTQEHAVKETVLYCNRMVGRIQTLPGYRTDLPVCIVGRYTDETVKNVDSSFYKSQITGEDSMDLFLNTVLYHDWCQEAFFRIYIGFGQPFLKEDDRAVISQKSEVQQMPDYPADGSVAIIENVIVVHLSN